MAGAAFTSADALLAQLQAQRLRWVVLDAAQGIRMRIDTPSQYRAVRIARAMRQGDGDAAAAELAPLLREWEGITGALLLGAAVGSGDAVPAHAGVFTVLMGDRPEWVSTLAVEAIQAAEAARAGIDAASGN